MIGDLQRALDRLHRGAKEDPELPQTEWDEERSHLREPSRLRSQSVLRQSDDLKELRIVARILAEENRIVRQEEILLHCGGFPSKIVPQRRQQTRSGRILQFQFDRHAAPIRSAVGSPVAPRIGEPHQRVIAGARTKDAERQFRRQIAVHDEARLQVSVRLGVLVAHRDRVGVATPAVAIVLEDRDGRAMRHPRNGGRLSGLRSFESGERQRSVRQHERIQDALVGPGRDDVVGAADRRIVFRNRAEGLSEASQPSQPPETRDGQRLFLARRNGGRDSG